MKSIKFSYLLDGFKLLAAKGLSLFMKLDKNNRDIWLIGERKNEAKDNGYHLFKYIRTNHPDKKIYYVIEKNSNDVEKLIDLGNIIYYGTCKHYLYYIISNKIICAHNASTVPDRPIIWKAQKYGIINKKKKIYIKHGIVKEKIPSLMYDINGADLFICGAKPEYEFVRDNFGYPKEAVKYLGLCRFDNLYNNNVKKQILVMPTWRKWIDGSTWHSGSLEDNRKKFIKTDYFNKYNDLLNNIELNEILEEKNYKLIFYPHYEMSLYIDLFKTNSKNIIIADKEHYDVQQLLKESEVLITDYSSVAFDFAYMRKLVIYYQFDQEIYYKNHYQKGYFNYESDGFGPVFTDVDKLVTMINNYINKNVEIDEYINKSKKFFPIYDSNNCDRHYRAIQII